MRFKRTHSSCSTFFLYLIVGIFSIKFLLYSLSAFHSNSFKFSAFPLNKVMTTNDDELQEVLDKTAMKNKTIIIALVNRAYVEGNIVPNMLDLFLEGFWVGDGTRELVKHLLIVAVDQTSYERCVFRGLHCYHLIDNGVDFMGEKVYMSHDFINMMWRRTLLLLNILRRGYNFIFTDADMIWLKNPFNVLFTNETQHIDIQFSIDTFNGNSTSSQNPINTGFYYVNSNNKTISLFQQWYDMKDKSPGFKEQDVLQYLVQYGALDILGLNVQFLDTKYFSCFCEMSQDIRSVVTVHANCCRFISAKVADLRSVLHDWARFKADPTNVTGYFEWTPPRNCFKSWQKNFSTT